MIEGRNRLGEEKSPYLLQHKDNPVHWFAWGKDAFEAAKERDVPIFLSVGYSTCHWCHVMEHDSFETEEVARLLNEKFVSIKVDREERPDIDGIYMDAVNALSGHGGWPMTVFMTPDRKPFFGGTFFPRARFIELINRIDEVWRTQRDSIEKQGAALSEMLVRQNQRARAGSLDDGLLVEFLGSWQASYDQVHGGRRGRPKFPSAADLRVLLRIHRRSGDRDALRMVEGTLDAMARGGIYDHLGGGFARYSTDDRWLVPHFEKMLYDQASLAHAYLEAWEVTGNEEYARVVREICDYVLRDMTHPGGGFYSAEDADSEGEEGKFYVWKAAELKKILDEKQHAAVVAAFGASEAGNFEHDQNILHLQPGHTRVGRSELLQTAMDKLFALRSKRIRPHLDDKILADWNGLMIAAMARAGQELGEPRYVDGARKAARFVLDKLVTKDGSLLHRWRDDEAKIRGFVEDYAFMTSALIELYQTDFDPAWLERAIALQTKQDVLFRDESTGDYFTTDGRDDTVLVRRVEPFDNVRPAGRSTTAMNLLRLGNLTLDKSYASRVSDLFAATPKVIENAPMAFGDLLLAVDYALDRSKEIALSGDPASGGMRAMLEALRGEFLPNQVIAAGHSEKIAAKVPLLANKPPQRGKVTAYVCENTVCKLPTVDPAKALELARAHAPLRLQNDQPTEPSP